MQRSTWRSARELRWRATFATVLALAALTGVQRLAAQSAPPPPRTGPLAASSTPIPVLLVPGWGDGAEQLRALEGRFVAAGWPEGQVARLSFRDPVGSNEAHSTEVAVAVADLLRSTGAAEVDLVAHSMGGLAVRRFLLDPNARKVVRRVVFLGTPHRGTFWATFVWGDGATDMVPGSDFLEFLNATPLDPAEVATLSIRTPVDTHVMPGSSAVLPGARNVEVCCPAHYRMIDHQGTFDEIRAFLRSENGR